MRRSPAVRNPKPSPRSPLRTPPGVTAARLRAVPVSASWTPPSAPLPVPLLPRPKARTACACSPPTVASPLLAAKGAGNGNSKALSEKLAVTQESLDTTRRENDELKGRMSDLQSQLDKLQRLIQLKDDQLAKLQGDLAKKPEAAAPATPATPTRQRQPLPPPRRLRLPNNPQRCRLLRHPTLPRPLPGRAGAGLQLTRSRLHLMQPPSPRTSSRPVSRLMPLKNLPLRPKPPSRSSLRRLPPRPLRPSPKPSSPVSSTT